MIPTKPPPSFRDPDKWSPQFSDFVSKCLVKNPEQRTSAKELLKVSWAYTFCCSRLKWSFVALNLFLFSRVSYKAVVLLVVYISFAVYSVVFFPRPVYSIAIHTCLSTVVAGFFLSWLSVLNDVLLLFCPLILFSQLMYVIQCIVSHFGFDTHFSQSVHVFSQVVCAF